jgi:predicted methyltransferase
MSWKEHSRDPLMRYHDQRSRRSWQNPEQVLVWTGLGPGATVVDIGYGEGLFALPAARIAG